MPRYFGQEPSKVKKEIMWPAMKMRAQIMTLMAMPKRVLMATEMAVITAVCRKTKTIIGGTDQK